MKTFDWEYKFGQTKNITKWEWVKSVQNKPITEEEFVAVFSAQPRYGRRPHKKYSPSNSRMVYRKLKANFGFF